MKKKKYKQTENKQNDGNIIQQIPYYKTVILKDVHKYFGLIKIHIKQDASKENR